MRLPKDFFHICRWCHVWCILFVYSYTVCPYWYIQEIYKNKYIVYNMLYMTYMHIHILFAWLWFPFGCSFSFDFMNVARVEDVWTCCDHRRRLNDSMKSVKSWVQNVFDLWFLLTCLRSECQMHKKQKTCTLEAQSKTRKLPNNPRIAKERMCNYNRTFNPLAFCIGQSVWMQKLIPENTPSAFLCPEHHLSRCGGALTKSAGPYFPFLQLVRQSTLWVFPKIWVPPNHQF